MKLKGHYKKKFKRLDDSHPHNTKILFKISIIMFEHIKSTIYYINFLTLF